MYTGWLAVLTGNARAHLDGSRKRPFDTVSPLAQDLGLEVDTSCDRNDSKCVKKVVKNYKGAGNILIW